MLRPDLRRVPVDVADEGLLAVVDHLHGALGSQREHRRVQLHREILPPAERSADSGQVHAHHLRRQAEAGGDLVAVDVRPLRRDVDVDAALPVGDRDPRLRSEERLILLPDLVDARHGHVAGGIGISTPDDDRADHVRPEVLAEGLPPRRPGG